MPTLKARGTDGEDLAAHYLTQQKLQIVARNWKCFLGELDIIAKDPKTKELIFVEVKSRFEDPDLAWESLHAQKQRKIKKLALAYLKLNKLPLETRFRFDAALVDLANQTVRHETNVFTFESELG